MTPKPTAELEKLKNRPITIAMLGAIVVVLIFVLQAYGKGEEKVQQIVQETLKFHRAVSVDAAHPDIKEKYTTHQAMEKCLGPMRDDLKEMRWSVQSIQHSIKKLEQRRGR